MLAAISTSTSRIRHGILMKARVVVDPRTHGDHPAMEYTHVSVVINKN
jgi:hypothetical protein